MISVSWKKNGEFHYENFLYDTSIKEFVDDLVKHGCRETKVEDITEDFTIKEITEGLITGETLLNDKQRKAYEKAKFLANRYYMFLLQKNPSGRECIKAIYPDYYPTGLASCVIDVELCHCVRKEDQQYRYEKERDIVPIKLEANDRWDWIWVKKGTEIGEDNKGWYYVDENNKKVYRYLKLNKSNDE